MFAFYAFKLISTSIEILIIPKPQGFWHTFKNPHPFLLFSKSPESLLGIQQVEVREVKKRKNPNMHMMKRTLSLILNFISKMITVILNIQCVFSTWYLASEKNAQMVFGEKYIFNPHLSKYLKESVTQ